MYDASRLDLPLRVDRASKAVARVLEPLHLTRRPTWALGYAPDLTDGSEGLRLIAFNGDLPRDAWNTVYEAMCHAAQSEGLGRVIQIGVNEDRAAVLLPCATNGFLFIEALDAAQSIASSFPPESLEVRQAWADELARRLQSFLDNPLCRTSVAT